MIKSFPKKDNGYKWVNVTASQPNIKQLVTQLLYTALITNQTDRQRDRPCQSAGEEVYQVVL